MGKLVSRSIGLAWRLTPRSMRRRVARTRNRLKGRSLIDTRMDSFQTRLGFLQSQLGALRSRITPQMPDPLVHWTPDLGIPANKEDTSSTRGYVRLSVVISALEERKRLYESELAGLSAMRKKIKQKKK